MRGRFDVRLNGESALSLSDDMYITDIIENSPKENEKSVPMGYTDGTRFIRKKRESLSVTVQFCLRKYSTITRSALYDLFSGWAKKGYLEISNRTDQRLYVDSVSVSGIGSTLGWIDTVVVVMTAYSRPFWESVYPEIAHVSTPKTSGKEMLFVGGNAETCPIDVMVTASGNLNTITIETQKSRFSFSGLELSSGDIMTISHDETGILSVRNGEESLMANRTAYSSDDLLVIPGRSNEIHFTANAPCTFVFSSRGRWL